MSDDRNEMNQGFNNIWEFSNIWEYINKLEDRINELEDKIGKLEDDNK